MLVENWGSFKDNLQPRDFESVTSAVWKIATEIDDLYKVLYKAIEETKGQDQPSFQTAKEHKANQKGAKQEHAALKDWETRVAPIISKFLDLTNECELLEKRTKSIIASEEPMPEVPSKMKNLFPVFSEWESILMDKKEGFYTRYIKARSKVESDQVISMAIRYKKNGMPLNPEVLTDKNIGIIAEWEVMQKVERVVSLMCAMNDIVVTANTWARDTFTVIGSK